MQIFNIETKSKIKSHQMPEQVINPLTFQGYSILWQCSDVLFSRALMIDCSINLLTVFFFLGCLLEVDHSKDAWPGDADFSISLVD